MVGRYLAVEIDRARAARHVPSVAEVQEIGQTAIGGRQLFERVEGLERYPISLRDWRDSPERLGELPVVARSGAHVPRGAAAGSASGTVPA